MVNYMTAFLAFLADFTATAANQASFAIQKVAHMDEEKKKATGASDEKIAKTVFCSMKGICGLFLVIIGFIGHFVALPFADLTLIACNSSSAVLMNVWISNKYLGEKFVPKYDVTAMCMVAMGTLVIIMLSNKESQVYTTSMILDLLTSFKSIMYIGTTLVLMLSVKMFMPTLLRKLRLFEQDCERFDERNARNGIKILPEKVRATDDETIEAERPDRVLMDILYGLPMESIKRVSPNSVDLKIWLKAPMLIFVSCAAMTSSLSELLMKVLGCILKDAEEPTDYLWLLFFIPCLLYTASRTLIYVNYGIKYYDQMEVMPIYQTNLLLHNIMVGMLCLNELKFYTWYMTGGICLSTVFCAIGIRVLLLKNKGKRASISLDFSSEDELTGDVEFNKVAGIEGTFEKLPRKGSATTEALESLESAEQSIKHDLHLVQTQPDAIGDSSGEYDDEQNEETISD